MPLLVCGSGRALARRPVLFGEQGAWAPTAGAVSSRLSATLFVRHTLVATVTCKATLTFCSTSTLRSPVDVRTMEHP